MAVVYASPRDSASATKPSVIVWATIAVESLRATRKARHRHFGYCTFRFASLVAVSLWSHFAESCSVTQSGGVQPGVSGDDKAACCRACLALGWLMAEDARNAPVWWDREFDSSGLQIRADVRTAGHEIWPSACRQARSLLGDVSDAAELIEQSVAQVSQYLDRAKAEPFSQNTRNPYVRLLSCPSPLRDEAQAFASGGREH